MTFVIVLADYHPVTFACFPWPALAARADDWTMAINDVFVAVDESTPRRDLHVLKHGASEDSTAAEFANTLRDTMNLKAEEKAAEAGVSMPVTQEMQDAAERVIRSKLVAFVIKDKDWERILVFNDGSALPIDTFLCGNGIGCLTRLGKLNAAS